MRKLLFLFVLPLFFAFSLDAIERYQLIDLGLLSYQASEATSINSHGQICGIYKGKNKSYVFIWDPSQPHFNYSKIRTSVKPLINNHSEIFGSRLLPVTDEIWDYEQEALFCWKNPLSFFTFLNVVGLGLPKEAVKTSPFDQQRTVLWDINDHGELVIMNSSSLKDFLLGGPTGFKYQVWIYQQGEYKLITHPQLYVGFSINNQSEVLGCYYEEIEIPHGDKKIGTSIYNIKTNEIRSLSLPPNAVGRAINDVDQVIGIFHHPNHASQGFLSDPSGNFIVLDNFNPIKSNNKNLLVGNFLDGARKGKPAIWDNGHLYDLLEVVDLVDDQGHVWDSLDELVDLNDDGSIIGQGTFKGMSHGFLLRPIR